MYNWTCGLTPAPSFIQVVVASFICKVNNIASFLQIDVCAFTEHVNSTELNHWFTKITIVYFDW